MPARTQAIQVALVEDDPEVRAGLHILIRASSICECIAAFGSAEEMLACLPSITPDVVLMDIQLPGMSGIECIRMLKGQRSAMQIMMLTVLEDHDRIFECTVHHGGVELARGSGKSKKAAESEAALAALKVLKKKKKPALEK